MTAKKVVRKAAKPQTEVTAEKAAQSTPLVKHVRTDVQGCSACGTDHTRVLFILREDWERKEYPYAAKCPLSGKSILMKAGS